MTLLAEVMGRPLDGGYAEAEARKLSGEPPPSRWSLAPVLAIAVILGIAVTWGVKVLRTPAEADQRARLRLEQRAEEAQARMLELRERSQELSRGVDELRSRLAAEDPAEVARARELAAAVGALAVRGQGLTVAIAPSAEALSGGDDDARVRARDIRQIVGALWGGGAEAVAVGGVRLVSTTAIRDVGDQIQVAFEPLATPYTITAIGPAAEMEVALAAGSVGDMISLLRNYLGADVRIDRSDELELPASADAVLSAGLASDPGEESDLR
jgi:uncharacterized protein YlxW (UPF0749 family)